MKEEGVPEKRIGAAAMSRRSEEPMSAVTPLVAIQQPFNLSPVDTTTQQATNKAISQSLETSTNRIHLIMTQYEQIEKDAKIELKELETEIQATKKELQKAEEGDGSGGLTMGQKRKLQSILKSKQEKKVVFGMICTNKWKNYQKNIMRLRRE